MIRWILNTISSNIDSCAGQLIVKMISPWLIPMEILVTAMMIIRVGVVHMILNLSYREKLAVPVNKVM